MPSNSRDEFSSKEKKILAARSAYRCNNPTCRKCTLMAHSNHGKYMEIGEAHHLYILLQYSSAFVRIPSLLFCCFKINMTITAISLA